MAQRIKSVGSKMAASFPVDPRPTTAPGIAAGCRQEICVSRNNGIIHGRCAKEAGGKPIHGEARAIGWQCEVQEVPLASAFRALLAGCSPPLLSPKVVREKRSGRLGTGPTLLRAMWSSCSAGAASGSSTMGAPFSRGKDTSGRNGTKHGVSHILATSPWCAEASPVAGKSSATRLSVFHYLPCAGPALAVALLENATMVVHTVMVVAVSKLKPRFCLGACALCDTES